MEILTVLRNLTEVKKISDIHKKIWPEFFEKILSGEKKFEIRLDDFHVKSGDILILEEWDPKTKNYTGRKIKKKISYLLHTKDMYFWDDQEILDHGFVVMSLEDEEV